MELPAYFRIRKEHSHKPCGSANALQIREFEMPSASALSTPISILDLPRPYLVFLGEARDFAFAKTAFGLRDWARESTLADTVKIVTEHGGASGVAFGWEAQLLATSKP